MTLEFFLLWIAIGAISGWLASALVGGGLGLFGDMPPPNTPPPPPPRHH